MKSSFLYIPLMLIMALTMLNGQAQNIIQEDNKNHLFHDEEPPSIQAYVLITDDRSDNDSLSLNLDFRQVLQEHLKESFPAVNFVFVRKMRELKRTGDNVNIMISVKYSGIQPDTAMKSALTHYHVTVYDVSRTPIFISDGSVKYDRNDLTLKEKDKGIEYTVTVANKRLVAFLKRNIKHRTFQKTSQNI